MGVGNFCEVKGEPESFLPENGIRAAGWRRGPDEADEEESVETFSKPVSGDLVSYCAGLKVPGEPSPMLRCSG